MLEFRILTSILTAYGKVINLKHETVLKHIFLENNILFVFCNIVQISYTAGCPISLLFLLSDACTLLGNALIFWQDLAFHGCFYFIL